MKRIFINFILSLLLITLAGIYLTRKTEEDSHLVRTSINGTEGILIDSHLVRTSINGTEGILIECSDCMPKPWLKSCPVPGMLLWVKDAETANKEPEKALHSLPPNLVVKQSGIPDGGLGVWAEVNFPKCTVFGPYGGEIIPIESTVNISGRYAWQITIDGEPAHWVDGANKSLSNWMRYINSANKNVDRNLQPFQSKDEIYYVVRKPIESGTELLVWYGALYMQLLKMEREKREAREYFSS